MTRRFQGLRKEGPRKRYDAVVIGAGIGGLFCANLMQREGLKVLLVEQHYMVGGYCSTFKRAGYTFDAATHFYPLLGNPSTLTGKLLQQLGIDLGWVKMEPVDTFHFPDGSRFDVPADLDTYRARLDAEFPHQKEALERFFQRVREAYLKGLLCYFRGHDTSRLGDLKDLDLNSALDLYIDDPKLKLLLTADCPHWGSSPERTSFVFDSMLRLSYFLGNYYPEGGSQNFADALAQRFEEQGGHILMSTEAQRLEVKDGRACGVHLETTRGRLKGSRYVEATSLVSNSDLRWSLRHLIPPEHVDAAYRRDIETMRPSFPCFLSHIGLRGVDPAALERAQGYYWNDWDPNAVGRNGLRCKIFSPTLYEPRMAPPGGQVVILQKVLEMDYDAVTSWSQHKQEIEDYVTAHLESVLPGIRDHIVVQTSASAQTSARFTFNEFGSMLGWEMSPDQLGESRPGIEGPIDGLYLVGHWTRPGGGITPVIISAMQVAQRLAGNASLRPNLNPSTRSDSASASAVDDARLSL